MSQLTNLMNPSCREACRSPMGVAIGKLIAMCIPLLFLILRNTVSLNYYKLENFEGLFSFLIQYWTLLCVTFILYRIVQEDKLTAQTRIEDNEKPLFKCDEKRIQKFLNLYTKGKIGRRELAIMWLMEGNNFDVFISKLKRDFGEFFSLSFERIFLEHNLINTNETVSQARTVKKDSEQIVKSKVNEVNKGLKILDGKLFTTTKFLELCEGEITISIFSDVFSEWHLLPKIKKLYSILLEIKHSNTREYDKIIGSIKMKFSLCPRSQAGGLDWGPFTEENTKALHDALTDFSHLMETLSSVAAQFDVSDKEEGFLLKSIFSNSEFATLIRQLVIVVFGNTSAKIMATTEICSLKMFKNYVGCVDEYITSIVKAYSPSTLARQQGPNIGETPIGLCFDKLLNLFFSNYIKDYLPEYYVYLAEVFKQRYYRFAVTSDFFVCLTEFIGILFKNIQNAIASRNPLLILGINGLDSMEEEILNLEAEFKSIFYGASSNLTKMPSLLIKLKKAESKFRKLKFVTDGEKLRFRSMYSRLVMMIDKSERVGKDKRVPPLGYIIQGPPGIGKTTLVEAFETSYKLKTSIPDFVNVIYNHTGVKHADLPPITKIMHINDYFSTKEENMKEPVVAFLQSAVDSHPFQLDRASIEDKKDSKIEPVVVFVSTNNDSYRIVQGIGADKLIRRYSVITGTFTREARQLALAMNVDEDELLKQSSISPVTKDTLVEWRISKLHVKEPETLQFRSGDNELISTFKSRAKLIHHLIEKVIVNYDDKVFLNDAEEIQFCEFCQAWGPHDCGSVNDPMNPFDIEEESTQSLPSLEEPQQQVKIGELQTLMDKMKAEKINPNTIPLFELDELFEHEKTYKILSRKHHPDKGGNLEDFKILSRFNERFKERIEATDGPCETTSEKIEGFTYLAQFFDLYFIPDYVRRNRWFTFFFKPTVDTMTMNEDFTEDLEKSDLFKHLHLSEQHIKQMNEDPTFEGTELSDYQKFLGKENFFKWTIKRMNHARPKPYFNIPEYVFTTFGFTNPLNWSRYATWYVQRMVDTFLGRPFDYIPKGEASELGTFFFIDDDLMKDCRSITQKYTADDVINMHLFPADAAYMYNINLIFKKQSCLGKLYELGVKEPSILDMILLCRLVRTKKVRLFEAERFFAEWINIYRNYHYLLPVIVKTPLGLDYEVFEREFKPYLDNMNYFWTQVTRAEFDEDIDMDMDKLNEIGFWCYSNHSLRVNLERSFWRQYFVNGGDIFGGHTLRELLNKLRRVNNWYATIMLSINLLLLPVNVTFSCLWSWSVDHMSILGISYEKKLFIKFLSLIFVYNFFPFYHFMIYFGGTGFYSYNFFEHGVDPIYLNGVNAWLRRLYLKFSNTLSITFLTYMSKRTFTIKRQRQFLACIAVLSLALFTYSRMRRRTKEQKEVSIVGESPEKTKEINKYASENLSLAAAGWVCGQTATYRAEELDESLVVKCTATTGNSTYTLHGIYLCNNCYLFPSHLFNGAQIFKTSVTLDGSNVTSQFSPNDYYQFPEEDLCIYRFLGESRLKLQGIDLIETAKNGPAVIKKSNVNITRIDIPMTLQNGKTFQHTITYTYGHTIDGDCGLPLRTLDGKIIGIHIAATGMSYGHAAFFSKEKIQKALDDKFKCIAPITTASQSLIKLSENGHTYASKKFSIGPHPSGALFNMIKFDYFRNQQPPFTILGNVNNTNTPKMTGRRSMLYDYFKEYLAEEYTAPKLRSWEYNGRWTGIAINKFTVLDYHETIYSTTLMDYAVSDYLSEIPKIDTAIHPFTLDSLINGDARHPWMKSRDDSKSVGISLNSKGVRHLEIEVDNKVLLQPKFYEEYNELVRIFENNERVSIIVNIKAVIKDELIATSKVEKGKGRWFYVSDVAFNLFYARYIKPIMLFCLQHMYWSNIFGTVNATSKDWKTLYTHLTAFNSEGFEFDQEGFDLHHRLFIEPYIETVVSIAKHIGYNISEQNILKRVMISSFNQLANLDNEIVFLNYGLASGRCDTMFANSVIHSLLYYYSFRHINGPKYNPRQYMRLAIVGDDTLLTLLKNTVTRFEGEEVKKIMYNIGYILTSARKDGSLLLSERVEKLTFLKRTFNIDGNNVFAPLSLASIYKTLCYHLELNCTPEEWRRGVLLSTQRELFMHGRDVLEEFQLELTVKNIPFEELKYDDLLLEYDTGKFTTLGSLTMAPVWQLDVFRF